MLNKRLLCAALAVSLNFSYIHQIHGSTNNSYKKTFLPIGKSKVTDKTVTLKFFKEKQPIKIGKNSKKHTRGHKQVALIRYSWTPDRTTIHLDFFKILSRKNRKKGLGTQIFTYFIEYLKKKERTAKVIRWTAQTLDPEHITQEKLEKFYKNLGSTKLYSELCNSVDCTCKSPITSQFSLAIDSFMLTDTSFLQTMNIIEESNIMRIKTLELGNKDTN